ncbi:MAG: YlxR family protein [Candidatus Binatia bacterium]
MRKTIPIRTCVGCGGRDLQSQLLRFFLEGNELLVAGFGHGRGGYLHPRRSCVQAFTKTRSGFVRSLRAVVSQEIRARFITQIESSAALLS